jgi:glycosyltransferase involved in cell wall biosynthesis
MAGAHSGEAARVKRVAVDLTPLLPGGDNGGAKPLAIELVRRLAAVAREKAPGCEFVLLTSEKSDAELALLDAPNVRRLCVSRPQDAPTISHRRALQVRALLVRLLPESVVRKIGEWYAGRPEGPPPASPLLRQIGADLLFCPFTGALFFDPAVPLVSLVHDLQYLYYPEFFDPADRSQRDRHFRQVCRVATRLICVSEFTRASVLEHTGLAPERVVAIPSAPQKRLGTHQASAAPGRYLLYPANFWRHKNHELLLTAFGIYRARHPQADLKLVLTGAPSPRGEELREAVHRMGLADWVVFAGYLPDEEFAALLAGCAAMIFPSLFEGFGMPALEAMAAGIPVLCGNLTSLPEITGDAALLFDPRRPAEIVAAIERLETDPLLRANLIERGRRRVAAFITPEEWAARFFAVFQDAADHPAEHPSAVYGVFPDGWTGGRLTVVFGRGPTPRRLAITLHAPEWLPSAEVVLRVGAESHRIPRGQRKTLTLDLPGQAGVVELLCSPTFQPGGEDLRQLGCLLESAAIVGPEGETGSRQLPREAHAA